ncbi:hypothetical protein PVAP13_8KG028151 [Panicum virgatum]|uniref:Uncharacterized protein n=1 Tax=Panicum virgatum TaxID=38727 RepID=A0A8T0PPJ2_PANVG|nr:hypothetical protein PVAP13_8KG028151 [Panicum virgatum]
MAFSAFVSAAFSSLQFTPLPAAPAVSSSSVSSLSHCYFQKASCCLDLKDLAASSRSSTGSPLPRPHPRTAAARPLDPAPPPFRPAPRWSSATAPGGAEAGLHRQDELARSSKRRAGRSSNPTPPPPAIAPGGAAGERARWRQRPDPQPSFWPRRAPPAAVPAPTGPLRRPIGSTSSTASLVGLELRGGSAATAGSAGLPPPSSSLCSAAPPGRASLPRHLAALPCCAPAVRPCAPPRRVSLAAARRAGGRRATPFCSGFRGGTRGA